MGDHHLHMSTRVCVLSTQVTIAIKRGSLWDESVGERGELMWVYFVRQIAIEVIYYLHKQHYKYLYARRVSQFHGIYLSIG